MVAIVEAALHEELATAKVAPYDSHPPLPERCAALARHEDAGAAGDTRLSITLLNGVEELERDLLGMAVNPTLKDAPQVEWSEVPELVWYPNWRECVSQQSEALESATVADAAQLHLEPQSIARKVVFSSNFLPDMEQRCAEARRLVGIALAVALVDAGWKLEGDLGEPITFVRETERLDPFGLAARLESGEQTPDSWREYCDRLGIAQLPLLPKAARGVASC